MPERKWVCRLMTIYPITSIAARSAAALVRRAHHRFTQPSAVRDVMTLQEPLPTDRELLAWRFVLGSERPADIVSLGSTFVADFALAVARCRLVERRDLASAADAVRRARDTRIGRAAARRYGFLESGAGETS